MATFDYGHNDPTFDLTRATDPMLVAKAIEIHKIGEKKGHAWLRVSSENNYRPGVLMGNWYDESEEINFKRKEKRLPSDFEHNYDTTYGQAYCSQPIKVPHAIKNLRARYPQAFPHHQPELDTAYLKAITNCWATSHNTTYVHPKLQLNPALMSNVDTGLPPVTD